MTDSTVEPLAEQEPEKKIGPGSRLREAREARKMTVEAAAVQLRIDPSLVRALEEDDYSKFAAPIFITGNIRAYARLLDLVPEPLLNAYHSLGRDEPPPLKHVKRYPRLSSTPSFTPVIIIALIIGIAVLIFLGWRNGAEMPSFSPADEPDMTLPEVPSFSVPPETERSDVIQFQAKLPDAPSRPSATEDIATPVPAPEVPRSAPITSRAALALKADQASWVEVRDANGRRLLYDLLDPGAMRNLEGTPPFEVLLGYAPGVTVEFNGKLVDHGPYTRKETARFKVGEEGAGRL